MQTTSLLLVDFLGRFAEGQDSLEAFHDRLTLGLQSITDGASDDDIDLLSEVLAGLYEVKDGVLGEDEYRSAVRELVNAELFPRMITVGNHLANSCLDPLRDTSSTADNLVVVLLAA